MNLRNKTILVTGGAGFIGSHLVDRLLKFGYRVVCLDNFDKFYDRSLKELNISKAREDEMFTLIEEDITNMAAVEYAFREFNPGLVIHLAAKAGVRPSIIDPVGYFNVNVNGTLNVLETMKKFGVNKMVFASSSSVYGNSHKVPFSESDKVVNPISPYAASKKAAELLCHTYHHLYKFDIFCLRFFTVFGPRQRPDLAIHKFTNSILEGVPIEMYGDGSSLRDYTYIDDIIEGIMQSIKYLKGYEIINLGESKTISLSEMIATLESKLFKKAQIIKLPDQSGDVQRTFADISKAKAILRYNPSWNFKEGIGEFLKWKGAL